MEKCQKCGASVAAGATQCAFCGAPTRLAHDLSHQAHAQHQHLAYQQGQLHLQQQVSRQHEAQASLKRTALHSVIWSALGMFCCLVPVFGIVGIVMALRARKMAKKYGLVIPATATLGGVMGAFSLLSSAGMYTFIVLDEMGRSQRIEELEARVAPGAQAQVLAQSVACDLAELRLLKDGIGSKSGNSVKDFECSGRLDIQRERAVLNDYSFRAGTRERHHVKVCFRRGARWTTTGFRYQASCDEPSDVAQLFPDAKQRPTAASASAAVDRPSPSAQSSRPEAGTFPDQAGSSPAPVGDASAP